MKPHFPGSGLCRNALLLLAILWIGPVHAVTTPVVASGGARKVLRVVLDDRYPPLSFRAANGSLQGILVDQWALWEKATGVRVQLDAMNWAEAQRRMEAGQYDVLDTVFSNAQRRVRYDFTPAYLRIDVPIFFSRELAGIRGPRDLAGFVVGAKRGDNSVDILREADVSTIMLFDNYEELIAAARDGRIKVFTVDQPPALYYLIKMGIQDRFRESEPLYTGEMHRAVPKGDRDTLALVERGFEAIPRAEYQRIERRWYGTPLRSRKELEGIAVIAGSFMGVLAILLVWVWTLRRMVGRRTAELRASQAYTQAIFHSVHDAVIIQDTSGRILDFNARAVEMFGHKRPALLVRGMAGLCPGPEAMGTFQRQLDLARRQGQALFEWTGQHADGHPFPLEVAVRQDRSGAVGGFILALRDISERKRIEAALYASELITKSISSHFTHGMIYQLVIDPDGKHRFTYLSESVQALYGVPIEAAMRDSGLIYARVHPEDLPLLLQVERDAVARLAPFKAEVRILESGGQVRWSSFVSTPSVLPDGSTCWDGIEFIITDQKRSQEALSASEALQGSLVNAIPDLICIISREGVFMRVHAPDPAILILPVDAFLHRKLTEVMPPPIAERLMEAIGQVMAHNQTRQVEYSLTIAGEERFFEARVAPCTPDSVIGIVRDVTAARRGEAQQRILQAQLLQAQKMESLGSLAGGVAHDMNNVLGAILAIASSNLDKQPEDSPLHRALEIIVKAASRGGDMVKSLLNFARQAPFSEAEVDLNAVVGEVTQLLERTTLARIRLVFDLAGDLQPLRGDANSIANCIMNLCVNAVDAMPAVGTLTLRTRNLDAHTVQVAVGDTGTGMSPEVLEKAVDPFFTTKGVGKGTGLGLSMVYGVVKAHRGDLDIQSTPGQGTWVTLSFPVGDPVPASLDPGGEAAGPAPRAAGLQVLLVDDDDLIMASLREILGLFGHSSTSASSGEAALALLEAGLDPDVVILDLNMPGLGGSGTLPRLRALRPRTPVVLMTGKADQVALDLVAAHPRVTLLPKPFSMSELRKQLEQLPAD
jgi:PAS domain S-box-containing protein